MNGELRQYQIDAVEGLRSSFGEGKKAPVLVAPCGSGKTIIAREIIQRAVEKGRNVLFLAPRRELIYQTSEKLDQAGIRHGIFMAGERPDIFEPVQVASAPTLLSRIKIFGKQVCPPADLVIVDECFVAGTLVDGKPIETVRVGDELTTGRVLAVSRKRAARVVRLRLVDGREIVCTPSHPFFTDKGWVAAERLTRYHKMVTIRGYHHVHRTDKLWPTREEALSALRKIFSPSEKASPQNVFAGMFASVEAGSCAEEPDKVRQGSEAETDAGKQPDEESCHSGEGERDIAGDGVGTASAGGQRARPDDAREPSSVCLGVGHELNNSDRTASRKMSEALQSGCGELAAEDSRGGGRLFSLFRKGARAGRAERRIFEIARLDSLEIYERGRGERFEELCCDGFVYNLRVEGSETYFANGILVHNCHLAITDSLRTIMEAYPDAKRVGLTATPVRGDGRGLGEMFDDLVLGPSVTELQSDGFLVGTKYFAPSTPDLTEIKIQMGDYNQKQLGNKMDDPILIGDVLENWFRIAPKMQTIVFCVNVAHSIHMRDRFRECGITADHIDAHTPNGERREIFRKFESGEIQVITNCQIFAYGVDVPPATCCVLAHPTKSLARYLQAVGRVLRPYPGKTHCVVIDHAGIINELGFVEDEFPWSLDGKGKIKDRQNALPKKEPKPLTCPSCKFVFSGAGICPACGHNMVRERKEAIAATDAELVEINRRKKESAKREWTSAEKECFFRELLGYAKTHGYKDGWAFFKYQEKFKVKPIWRKESAAPSPATLAWIRSRQIAYAMAKKKENAAKNATA